jgi:hypothetical protein
MGWRRRDSPSIPMPALLIFEIFFKFQEQVKETRINSERLQKSDIRQCGGLPVTPKFDRTGRSLGPATIDSRALSTLRLLFLSDV